MILVGSLSGRVLSETIEVNDAIPDVPSVFFG
jgi:hypothetical protein